MAEILTSGIDWEGLSETVRKEQRNRERWYPTISTYRWWARRSHAVIGSLLDRAIEQMGEDIIVSDPMAGGGTVAVEAARRGLTVYAQDINPWVAFGLEATLRPVDPDQLEKAGQRLLECIAPLGPHLYAVPGDEGGTEAICQLHVRRIECSACTRPNFLYPTVLLALDKRITGHPTGGWYGCPACGAATHGRWPALPNRCDKCSYLFPGNVITPRIRRLAVGCVHCQANITLGADMLYRAPWMPVLAQVRRNGKMGFMPGGIPLHYRRTSKIGNRLDFPIPEGIETNALRNWGYRTWRDLYPERQLRIVEAALKAIQEVTDCESVAQRLRVAVMGFAEMAGYAARWDPRYLKVYEVGANHHYSRVVLAAEVNPLASLGRGTLHRRIAQAIRAARWFSGSNKAKVTLGSSERQPVPNQSVDIVVTDPPYFDSVQYSELSRLLLAFGYACGLPVPKAPATDREAVPNRMVGRNGSDYGEILAGIMQETARTLKPSGRLVLTFHNRHREAWEALDGALSRGGLCVLAQNVVHAENETDFPKRERLALTSDLVLECKGCLTNPYTRSVLPALLDANARSPVGPIRQYI